MSLWTIDNELFFVKVVWQEFINSIGK